MAMLEVAHLKKVYTTRFGGNQVEALRDVSFTVEQGEYTAIHQSGQTIVMVTHSTKAAASAGRVMFIKDGEVFHQLYRGNDTNEQFYQRISDTLTLLTTGGEAR